MTFEACVRNARFRVQRPDGRRWPGSALDSDDEKMDEMIRLNVGALTRLTYAAAPGLVARGGGTIINIASIVAISPETLNGVYGASKAFVLALSHSLNHELAGKRVWDIAGLPVRNLPTDTVMSAQDMVDAPLAVSTRERSSPFHPCPTKPSGIVSTRRAGQCPPGSRVLSQPADTTSGISPISRNMT
jgi:NAD(P)-dependent dehydrogenase (short-subunit alcohol dehydrogenase family)